jgi:xanthine dehydrogenase accessory factor
MSPGPADDIGQGDGLELQESMKELREILKAYRSLEQQGKQTALATVVAVSGSSYRRPGARMLMTIDGPVAGGVSGGCLETDVFQRACLVMEQGKADLVTYDTTEDGDIVFGVGLGCRGVIQILIEPLLGPRPDFKFLAGLIEQRERGVCAMVFRSEDNSVARIGERLLLSEAGDIHNGLNDSELARRVLADAQSALTSGKSRTKEYAVADGSVEVWIETLLPPQSLVIFGAGHDAPPLVRLAKELGWHVSVVDPRPAYATAARFPQADAVHAVPLQEALSQVTIDARTAVVLLTHNYPQDLTLLEQLLPRPLAYLGVLGPKRRTERLLGDLPAALRTDEDLANLHSPVGLDIGADSPELIALSILAEIQAVTAGRPGGFLRERPGPIYPPTQYEIMAQ